MNVVGRHVMRSGAPAAAEQNLRRYASEGFLDVPPSNDFLTSSQEFGFFGATAMGRRSPEPVFSSRELSPGLLDLHSFDTEFLSEVPGLFQSGRAKTFNDSESVLATNKAANMSRGLPDNNIFKSIPTSLPENLKERANNVAKIKVVVRKRPLNKKEMAKKEQDIITTEPNSSFLTVHETKLKVDLTEYVEKHEFVFDAVLNENVSNDEVYSETVEPVVPLIFKKTKATCFAYGQTGSGKTFTMQPLPLRASQDILRMMHYSYRNQGFQLFVSFFEIYGGKVFDLLNDRKKLFIREDGKQQVCIVGLQEFKVFDVELIKELIEKGNTTRSTGITGANEESSRSHAILQLVIKKSVDGNDSKPPRPVGKLSFIDLAGSERGADTTDNDKQTRMEGADINKSLLALKECIRALDNDQGHIPFRGSKLTEVLRDSFVGDSRTVMISCISPSSGSCEHTLNTLRYADRVKSLSKGSMSKKDLLASSNIKDYNALPSTSAVPAEPILGNNINNFSEKMRFGWSKQNLEEPSPPYPVERVPSGRMDPNFTTPVFSDYSKFQKGDQTDTEEDDLDYSLNYEQEKQPSAYNNGQRKVENQTRQPDILSFEANSSSSDENLNALLKEEENLVSAHRKQVEETMEIVREEMNLLFEAGQPGNQLDEYLSKLSTILSHKASAILQLQNQLARFQKLLDEHNVLVSSDN